LQQSQSGSVFWLLRYLKPVRGRLLILLGLLFITIALQLIQPQIIRTFIDNAADGEAIAGLLRIAGLFLAAAAGNQLATLAVSYFSNDVAWRATNRLRSDLLNHCLRLDMSFHNNKTPGEMIERIDGDVTNISNFFAMFIVQIIGSFALLSGILGYMFIIHPQIAVIMVVFTGISIGTMFLIRNVGVAASQNERQASASLFGFIEERLAGVEDVQANGSVPYVMNRFHRSMRNVFVTGRRALMLRVIPWNTTVALFTISVTAVMVAGVRMYVLGQVSIGTLFLFFQYTQMLNDPIEQLGNQMQEFQKAKSGMRRSRELLSLNSKIAQGSIDTLPDGALKVEFAQVNFSYTLDQPVLRNIDFTLRPGERLGLIGRTGSGKSSISRLLLRLYEFNSGAIRLSGIDIRTLSLDAVYRRVGMVTQDVQLFDGSLRDNLTLFNPRITDREILATTADLGLKPWIDRLPDGLNTHLAPGGTSLSAGEAQLFALTRVFLTRPSLVILDEPSSRLDAATEAMLQSAIDRLLEQCTGIVIAHRLSTLKQVDTIMVLEQGEIVEFGPRKALAKNPDSRYAQLLAMGSEEVCS
jgi:ATP-binding cassette subfamily B protein